MNATASVEAMQTTDEAKCSAIAEILWRYCLPRGMDFWPSAHLSGHSYAVAAAVLMVYQQADVHDRERRVASTLLAQCDPKRSYDGIGAWEIARKIVAAVEKA